MVRFAYVTFCQLQRQFQEDSRLSHSARYSAVFAASLLCAGVACADPVEVLVWHTLNPHNAAEFQKLAQQFNKEQGDVKVVLRGFPSQAAMLSPASRQEAEKRKPDLVQLDDRHSPEVTAQNKEIVPLYQLLKQYPISDLGWYLPQTTGFVRDSKNQLLAFPFMAEIPVMFYNLDAYRKAGLNPAQPAATWTDLQGHLIALRDKADIDCPYATSEEVLVHLESLAPINNSLYATPNNGLDNAKGLELNFDTVYMRHMAIMVSWKKSLLFTTYSNGNEPDKLFADGKCAVLTAGSGSLGQFQDAKGLKTGVAPIPYHPLATSKPGAPFVTGSALWATSGQPKEQNKATMGFLAFLSKPVLAAQWHQHTGFLPLTDAAFRSADVVFYDSMPGVRQVIEIMKRNPEKNQRGFRLPNYAKIEPILVREFEAAMADKTPPVLALNNAMDQAKPLLQEGEKPAKPAPAARKK